ncbi:hypothetical protein SAMN05428975_5912 [Mucilaginibacter sp. OK268]|uniref:hypothetical protein n=1 Tax=Mucilaginibacter sp. OK268 TaxID=1881048 RepID=UPI000884D473|nr:hypothetical protein [Mucilaginibacter sp. OK268]SDQ01649.1 hypothetical protein SAMN05428975_5912 [Mucilaginibacter sp. OK268]
MKKLIFSLSLFLSFSSLVHAQWVTNGTNTITSTTNSVGVGTTNPDEKLVVNGNIKTVLESTYNPAKNVATIKQLGLSGATGAMNWTLRGVYQYTNGVLGNADGGDLDLIKSLDGNTILGTKTDGAALGKVGIGTTAPAAQLHVQVSNLGLNIIGGFRNSSAGVGNGAVTAGTAVGIGFLNEPSGNWWKAAIVHERTNAFGVGRLHFLVNNSMDNSTVTLTDAKMTIETSGNVGIGITNPQNKLDVNGRIHSQSVLIDMNGWSDYVFKKDYQLPSLQEVKNYIDQNQHLPEIPSEQQITKEGLNLGEMNKLLMKKVEELTLYLIEKDNKQKEQEQLLYKLQGQLNQLIKQVKINKALAKN